MEAGSYNWAKTSSNIRSQSLRVILLASMLMPEVRKVLGYLPVRRTLAFITLIRQSPDTTPIDSAMTMSTTQRTKEFQTTSRDQMGAL